MRDVFETRRAIVASLLATVLAFGVGAASGVARAAGADSPTPVWQWSEESLRSTVEAIRAGRNLRPKAWPGGARVAVALSFDVDTEPLWLSSLGLTSPSYMSRGEYGARRGMPRILDLLDELEIPASFFVPAASLLLHPEIAAELKKRPQHEVAFHSYVHENPLSLSREQERGVYEKALGVFDREFGKRPVGFRSAVWDLSDATIDLVREMGFLYDSSMMADDHPYTLLARGEDTGLVELPVEWILDDFPYFGFLFNSSMIGLRSAAEVLPIWKEEFDGAYREGGLFLLVMHPQVIGKRYRIAMLRDLLDHIRGKDDVWFATHEEIARYLLQESPAE